MFFIRMTDPTKKDILYIHMLLDNWGNYYQPENYLLPNTQIIDPNSVRPLKKLDVKPIKGIEGTCMPFKTSQD